MCVVRSPATMLRNDIYNFAGWAPSWNAPMPRRGFWM